MFDYSTPAELPADKLACLQPGVRLRLPFGKRSVVGILLRLETASSVSADKLREFDELIDETPIVDAEQLRLLQWLSSYHHHPLGDTISNFLPGLLRKGRPAQASTSNKVWRLTTHGKGLGSNKLRRAPRQAQLMNLLQEFGEVDINMLKEAGISTTVIRSLQDKELIEAVALTDHDTVEISTSTHVGVATGQQSGAIVLAEEQQQVISQINSKSERFRALLLQGVTGSGKTEVYLQAIDRILRNGKQALVLVPEIGLTPQMLQRFVRRFGAAVTSLHSGLSEAERLANWLTARNGTARVVIGTRSAVLAPMPELGMIVVDEEHDASYKQQDGLRYSARDIAIKRAQLLGIPVLLGSATPSSESLYNIQ
ncbi:MAG: DEAD/DEAH box helicase, partial [Pseudomonadales bacterium]